MADKIEISLPRKFSFRHTVESHGWYDLPPFEHQDGSGELGYVFGPAGKDGPITATIKNGRGRLSIGLSAKPRDEERVAHGIRHILRLDEDLGGFYSTLE